MTPSSPPPNPPKTATSRGRKTKINADEIACPPPTETPDWTPKMVAALAQLTPLESAFVQWMCTGLTAAEAYRRAGGKSSQRDNARQSAYKIRHRPHVQKAFVLALKDRNFSARHDREWLLQALGNLVFQCQDSAVPHAADILLDALKMMAQLQGEIPNNSPKTAPASTKSHDPTPFDERLRQMLADVKQSHPGGESMAPLIKRQQSTPATKEAFVEADEATTERPLSVASPLPKPPPPITPTLFTSQETIPPEPQRWVVGVPRERPHTFLGALVGRPFKGF